MNTTTITKSYVNSVLKNNGISVSWGNSKLGKIPNFNLTPGLSCSREACATCHCGRTVDGKETLGCYACKAYRQYPNARKAWDGNTEMALYDVGRLYTCLDLALTWYENSEAGKAEGYRFRIHSAGDFITESYAIMWFMLADKHPKVQFLAFTKQYDKVEGIPFWSLPNFSLRPSEGWGLTAPKEITNSYLKAYVIEHTTNPAPAFVCGGDCRTCSACWKQESIVAFHNH